MSKIMVVIVTVGIGVLSIGIIHTILKLWTAKDE